MAKTYSKKTIVNLISKIDMEPSDKLAADMQEELRMDNRSIFTSDSKKNLGSFRKRMVYITTAAFSVFIVGVIVFLARPSTTIAADSYSFVKTDYEVNSTADVSEEFLKNYEHSTKMVDSFFYSLPYNSRYKAPASQGAYTMNGFCADEFPDYYAGMYFNVDGHLIIQIKSSYYEKSYRKCKWYSELAKMLGSENFACRPANYNFSDLMNGMSDIVFDELSKQLKEEQIETVEIGINDYLNQIEVEVRTDADAKRAEVILTSDMYKIVVVGDVTPQDY